MSSSITDRLYGGKVALDNIVIVKIDDESINKIGRWPWDRNVFSQLLEKVKDAKAIGVDVSFFEKSGNDSSLENTLGKLNNVALAAEINENVLYTPIFNKEYGYVNLKTDNDGITRSLDSGLKEEILPFSFKIYQKALGKEASFSNGIYMINFVSGHFNSESAYDVLQQNLSFKDKIVLIGATAPNLHDNYFVPTSEGIAMSGVELHANTIQNLILDNFLRKENRFAKIIFVFLAGSISLFLISRLRIYYLIPLVLAIIILYAFLGIYLFSKFNYIIDLFFLPTAVLVFAASGIGLNYIEEKRKSRYITDAFGKYVSKELLNEIINKKHELKLGGTKRNVTIFFSDIRGFTSISEKLSPEELVSFINEYLTDMTKIILKHKGTVDKFIGDAIMALWNAPVIEENHAELACESAIEQIKVLKELRKRFAERKMPKIEIGCGINTGEAIIGNMGSEDRFDYTAMGDNVNLASRLEGLTKIYGVNIIISEPTYGLVKDRFRCRKLDSVKVKGKAMPVVIYELCTDYNEKFSKQYEKALGLYFKSRFKEALDEFKKALKLKKDDVASELFIERCRQYIETPPKKGWDGSFKLDTK